MSFIDLASEYFPNVRWTGGSHIHVSHAGVYPGLQRYTREDAGLILKMMERGNAALDTYGYLTHKFPAFEFLIAADQFKNLFMVDMYRHLHNMGACYTEGKFQNPVTSNWFHRIAVHPRFIGGFRNWADNADMSGHLNIGWRFRIVGKDEEEEVTRERAERIIEVAQTEIVQVQEAIANEVKEPSIAKVMEAVGLLEGDY